MAAVPALVELAPLIAIYGPLLLQAPAIINSFADAARYVHDTYRKAAANAPAAKNEALQQFREESRKNHEESVSRMKELHQRMEETAREQEEAAARRIREQKKEADEALKAFRDDMRKDEEKRQEIIRKMKEEHEEKMREIRMETLEERQKVEKEHTIKMEKMEMEQKEEKKEAERKLEEVRRNGTERIRAAEEDKERVDMERDQAMNQYRAEMEKLTRMNNEQLSVIQKETAELRIENAREQRRQLMERNQAFLRQIEEQTAQYVNHLRLRTNIGVITQFQTLLEPFHDIDNAMEAIHTQCSPPIPHAEALITVPIGYLDAAFEVLEAQRAVYQNRLTRFQQYVRNAHHVHPQIYQVCRNLITNMTNNVQNQDISRLLLHLPRAIDSRSSAEIIHYGQVAGTVHTQFRGVCETVENELNEVTLHLHEQGDANVAAIGDNIPE